MMSKVHRAGVFAVDIWRQSSLFQFNIHTRHFVFSVRRLKSIYIIFFLGVARIFSKNSNIQQFSEKCRIIVTGQSIPLQKFTFVLPCIRNRFLFKWPTRRTNYPNFFCYKTLHVPGILSAYHQEFSTVPSAVISFMQVFDDRFQGVSSWLYLETVIKNLHENYQCHRYSREPLMMGREDTRNM